jgi:hypothetical protein
MVKIGRNKVDRLATAGIIIFLRFHHQSDELIGGI